MKSKLKEPSKDECKKLLMFGDTHLAFLTSFCLNVDNDLVRAVAITKLSDKDINACWCGGHCEHFRVAEEFILSDKSIKERFRLRLDDFSIKSQSAPKCSCFNDSIQIGVFLTIYPKLDIATLLFTSQLKKCTTDDLIFFKQCFQPKFNFKKKFKLDIVVPSFLQAKGSNNHYISDVLEGYIESISSAFGSAVNKSEMAIANLIEIRCLNDVKICDPEDYMLKKCPKQIYGVLTGDEGWRYVPRDIARSRMMNGWRTRDFLAMISFHHCVLFFNLSNGRRCKKYIKSQNKLRHDFGQNVEPYFNLQSDIPGLKHGPLLSLENTLVMRFLLDQYLVFGSKSKNNTISEFVDEREKMIGVLRDLASFQILEIHSMDEKIRASMSIKKDITVFKDIFKQLEKTLVLKYTQQINKVLISLAILGLIIAIWQAVPKLSILV